MSSPKYLITVQPTDTVISIQADLNQTIQTLKNHAQKFATPEHPLIFSVYRYPLSLEKPPIFTTTATATPPPPIPPPTITYNHDPDQFLLTQLLQYPLL